MKSIINRFTNLLTILVFASFIVSLCICLSQAWSNTAEWDRVWGTRPNLYCEFTSDQCTKGLQRAIEAGDSASADSIREILNQYYYPVPNSEVRLSSSELLNVLKNSSIALIFILIPIIVNYLVNGKLLIWNRESSLGNGEYVIHRYNAQSRIVRSVSANTSGPVVDLRSNSDSSARTSVPSSYSKVAFYGGLMGLILPPLFIVGIICALVSLSKGERNWRMGVGFVMPLIIGTLKLIYK